MRRARATPWGCGSRCATFRLAPKMSVSTAPMRMPRRSSTTHRGYRGWQSPAGDDKLTGVTEPRALQLLQGEQSPNAAPAGLPRRPELRQELEAIRKNFDDERWAGVIEFAAALHGNPTPLLEYLARKSQLGSVKNFPTMARRTQTLLLLYRCLASGVNIPNRVREDLYRKIVAAQGHMSKIFRNGGVFPIAVLIQDGVRHSYLYYKRRPTLKSALQPFRRLGVCAVERILA